MASVNDVSISCAGAIADSSNTVEECDARPFNSSAEAGLIINKY